MMINTAKVPLSKRRSPLSRRFQATNPRNRLGCPGTHTKCCSYSSPQGALPTFDLLASSDLSPVDSNTLSPVGDLTFAPDDNLFTTDDGSTFNPAESQISYSLTDSPLDDVGTTLTGMNDGLDQTDMFANVEGDGNPLDLWS